MTGRQVLSALAALALGSAPAFAQGGQAQGQAAGEAHEMSAHAMICTMGMLPHPGTGGAMMGGQGMGGMMQGMGGMMQQGTAAGGMQHGAMGGVKQDSAKGAAMAHGAGGMQHGAGNQAPAGQAMGGMQHAAGAAAEHGMEGMEHPVTPTMLLHHAQEIGLTAEQQEKVSELARTSQASCEQHLEAAAGSHKAAAALLGQDSPDVAAYQARLRETLDHILQGHVAVIKAGIEAKALLAPDQRDKLKHVK
jgi:hypothetical protein